MARGTVLFCSFVFSFSFVLRVEGPEHTIHFTPGIGEPYKTLFLWAVQLF